MTEKIVNKINEESHLPDDGPYTPEQIDTIDVFYCGDCLSLDVRRLHGSNELDSYCDKCFSTNIRRASVYKWEELYIERYGKPLVTRKNK